jgi:predicted component of type VI protein secretion system
MEINGIKIRDMKDAQDILMALELIKANIENITNDLSNNHEEYLAISKVLNQFIIDIKNIQSTSDITKENILAIQNEFLEFDKTLKTTFKEALNKEINKIDLSTLESSFKDNLDSIIHNAIFQIQTKTNDEIVYIKQEVDYGMANFKKATQTLEKKSLELEDTIKQVSFLKRISRYIFPIVFAIGGFFAGLNYQLIDFSLKEDKLHSFLEKNKIDIDFNYYENRPYLSFQESRVHSTAFSKIDNNETQNRLIIFKKEN